MQNDEESVKLDDLVKPYSQGRKMLGSNNSDKKNRPRANKNIFFNICSAQNDEDDDPVLK